MTLADRIRRHCITHHVEPARRTGRDTVAIRAGDVARNMVLNNRAPAVCSALGSNLFLEKAGLRLLERKGPHQSTTTEFYYAILDWPAEGNMDDSDGKEPVAVPQRTADDVSHPRTPSPDDDAGNRLYLVSCVKTKRSEPVPAKDLYVSDWFRKTRAYVEKTGCPWRILSAQYGLIHPEEDIRPYEKTLNNMPVAERCAWARGVLAKIEPCLDGVDTVVFFAGERYREFLEPELRKRGVAVCVPMASLSRGRQLTWLNAHVYG